jgi:AmmeMemoRadiSam system protein A
LDHATIVPLSFIEPTGLVPIVVISLSYLSYALHRAVGEAAAAAATALGRRAAFVASGDLSHRLTPDAPAGFSLFAKDLDAAIVSAVRDGKLERLALIDSELVEAGGECGLRSFIALGGYVGTTSASTKVLAYEGPWGVGYLTALVGDAATDELNAVGVAQQPAGRKGGMPGQEESEIVALARRAIESYVRHRESPHTPALADTEYPSRAGTFVSLHRADQLRGCIGTILPTRDTLAQEVVGNAIEAATRDPRFPPLETGELEDLEVKVDVLHAPQTCEIGDLDPQRYGVITSSGWRRGLLLPALEGVDDVETQVRIAMSKAGINPGEPCSFERFRVDRYT